MLEARGPLPCWAAIASNTDRALPSWSKLTLASWPIDTTCFIDLRKNIIGKGKLSWHEVGNELKGKKFRKQGPSTPTATLQHATLPGGAENARPPRRSAEAHRKDARHVTTRWQSHLCFRGEELLLGCITTPVACLFLCNIYVSMNGLLQHFKSGD